VGIGGESMPKDRVTLWITLIRRKKNHPLVDFGPRQQFLHVLQTRCVFVQATASITAVSKSTQNQGSLPYHIKLAPVTYSTWLQQSGWSSWDGLKSTHMVSLTRVTCEVGPGAPPPPNPFSDQVLICLLVVFLDFLKCKLNHFFLSFLEILIKLIFFGKYLFFSSF